MAWARFDDRFNQHPKVVEAGPLAQLLHMRAIIWCAQYGTDGFITYSHADALWSFGGALYFGDEDFMERADAKIEMAYVHELVERLVSVGLWIPVEAGDKIETMTMTQPNGSPIPAELERTKIEAKSDGWWIHDYLCFNFSAELAKQREAKLSNKRSTAGRKGGKKSGESRRSSPKVAKQTRSKHEANAKQNEENAKQNEASNPNPNPNHIISIGNRNSKTVSPDLRTVPDNLDLDPGDVEAAAFKHLSFLSGPAQAKIRALCPIKAWELKAAVSKAREKGALTWPYVSAVLGGIRKESQETHPKAQPRREPIDPIAEGGRRFVERMEKEQADEEAEDQRGGLSENADQTPKSLPDAPKHGGS